MNITSTLAENVLAVFEGNNWVEVGIATTLSDVSWQHANTRTPGSVNTIAGLVHHLGYWNGIIIQRLQGEDPVIPESNGFDFVAPDSAQSWTQLIEHTHQSFVALSEEIKKFDSGRFGDPTNHQQSTFRLNLFGIIEHAYYHLGQITILKKLVTK